MFHDGQTVLGLLLLQIKNCPQLLQLLQLTESLQHHQHGNQTEEEIHCGTRREERNGEIKECNSWKYTLSHQNTTQNRLGYNCVHFTGKVCI